MTHEQGGAHSVDPNTTRGRDSSRRATPGTSQDGRIDPSDRDWDSGHVRSIGDRHGLRDRETQDIDYRSVTGAQKDEHGGLKIGSAFFGWLTATGMAVLLTALLAAIGAGVGVVKNIDVSKATSTASSNSTTVGIVGAIVLLVIVLVSYYCGGYVAGRMARFNGVRQGIAVWLWALLIVVVLAILAAVGGEKYNVLAKLNAFPRIPVKEGTLTTTGIIALIAVVLRQPGRGDPGWPGRYALPPQDRPDARPTGQLTGPLSPRGCVHRRFRYTVYTEPL